MPIDYYSPQLFGAREVALLNQFFLQMHDAQGHFLNVVRPRLDRSYKLYVSFTGDRQREIDQWQSNVFVPYIQAAVETLIPRILDARPEFTVLGRTSEFQAKAEKQQYLMDYFWENAKMDSTAEMLVRSALIYGTGYLQVSWKKDVRELKFLKSNDILGKKLKWVKEEKVFFDAPFAEWVDPYFLWYDWHNTTRGSKQYWFKRHVLTAPEIRRRYPMADKTRLEMALARPGGDLNDYAAIRYFVKSNHDLIVKGTPQTWSAVRGFGGDKYQVQSDQSLRMYEVFEWWRPYEDSYSVIVNYVPIMKGGEMPIPYDFKEAPFLETPYLKLPNEFEGYGLPMILENPQIMLNMIKNQRLDAATLSIHKMWIVNPLANINKEELVTRPFGIIYSMDPNGVREVQFSDIKMSAYKEEDLLKADMRYSSGVDDSSMGVGGSAGSATEVRHLRESTLERVRLFVNHLGDTYADVMRYWMSMQRQFFTKNMQIRILGKDGSIEFPLIEKDDLKGEFDYKASVLPSIAGQQDIKKKQDMDLFQLLVSLPFVDPRKLTSKILSDWNFSLDSISKDEEPPPPPGMDPNAPPGGDPNALPPGPPGPEQGPAAPMDMSSLFGGGPDAAAPPTGASLDPQALAAALRMLGRPSPMGQGDIPPFGDASGFGQASAPINLLSAKGPPPTARGIPNTRANPYITTPAGQKGNPRGLNRGGKVNTNISSGNNSNPTAALLTRTFNTKQG